MNASDLLTAPFAYMPPARLLDGLTEEQAAAKPPGWAHSIVEILAHVDYWQNWFVERCSGVAAPMAAHAADGWPAAGAGDWTRVRDSFLAGLDRLVALSPESAKRVEPAIEFPPMASYTIGEAITHTAVHNAHHLGQIVTLRQMQGSWPPPEGSWTW